MMVASIVLGKCAHKMAETRTRGCAESMSNIRLKILHISYNTGKTSVVTPKRLKRKRNKNHSYHYK